MSTKPGATRAPSASTVRWACSSTFPTATTFPSATPTSAVRRGVPVPSINVPPRMIRSSMRPPGVPSILPTAGVSDQRRGAYAAGVVRLVGLWTEPADIDAFEREYLGAHYPQLAQLANATSSRTSRAFDGPYFRFTEVMFDSADDIHAALETETGERILSGARALEAKFGIHLDVMIIAD